MIPAALALCLGALIFDPQDIEGFSLAPPQPLTDIAIARARACDLDGDGKRDWLLRDGALLQRDEVYPEQARVAWPSFGGEAEADAWGKQVYVKDHDALRILHLEGSGWGETAALSVQWPRRTGDAVSRQLQGSTRQVYLGRFLNDLNGDGAPEIVQVDEGGILVYDVGRNACSARAPLDLLPPLSVSGSPQRALWPAAERSLRLPARQMACRVAVEGGMVRVLAPEPVGEAISYAVTEYREIFSGPAVGPPAVAVRTRPMPPHVLPCRLNGDAEIDYAGARWTTATLPMGNTRALELWATLDGGASARIERTSLPQGYEQATYFCDVDGDSALDLVVEGSSIYEGGVRESAIRFATGREIVHTLRVFKQEHGQFAKRPTYEGAFTIALDGPLLGGGLMAQRYWAGGIVDLRADFDGDGLRDAAVRDRIDRVTIHCCRGTGYSRLPDATIAIEASANTACMDMNGDGRGDLVCEWRTANDAAGNTTRVFFGQGATP